ncbi:MAG: BON domain-containing protein [Sulfurifustaceae bacterium]
MKVPVYLGGVAALTLVAAYGSTNVARTIGEDAVARDTSRAVGTLNLDSLRAARIAAALEADASTRGADIHVTFTQGRVRLSGFVDRAAARLRAAELTQRAEGVIDVENRLILPYRPSAATDAIVNARVLL